jgi:hypothetical protein
MRTRHIAFAALVVSLVPAVAVAAPAKDSLHATLTGKAETPKGDPDGRGTAEIKINGRQVCWELTVRRIAKPNAAHIHKGRAGVAGPVVVPLGATYRQKGCTRASAATASAIRTRPSTFYVNVHNVRYPGGAVRGQLRNDG